MTKKQLDKHYGVIGVSDLFKESQHVGNCSILPFEFKEPENFLFNLRQIRDNGSMFTIQEGKYVRLVVNGSLMMSDTGMERLSNKEIIEHANGRVLIAGLGIGLIIRNILLKGNVTEIVVIEKYKEVIELVGNKFKDKRLKIIEGCIHDYKPDQKFDTIYFDIWPDINTDNLEEIRILHNKFKFFLNRSNPNFYMNSWMKEFLQRQKRKENQY